MPTFKLNIFTGELDMVRSVSFLDGQWLRLDASNDPVTGELLLNPTTDSFAADIQQDFKVKSGKKFILDGS